MHTHAILLLVFSSGGAPGLPFYGLLLPAAKVRWVLPSPLCFPSCNVPPSSHMQWHAPCKTCWQALTVHTMQTMYAVDFRLAAQGTESWCAHLRLIPASLLRTS